MNETADLGSHILIVAIIAFYWALLGNWGQLLQRWSDLNAKPKDAPSRPADATEDTSAPAGPLDAICEIDPDFDPVAFLASARSLYEIVLQAYAEGDIEKLKRFVGPDVLAAFEGAITTRRDRKETLQLTFIGMRESAIVRADGEPDAADITVRFVSDVVSTLRNAYGAVVEGDPWRVVEVRDEWTFASPVDSRDPDWTLVATDEG